jgi:protein MPE1
MSSSVFYKWKNSREPERITFNGTSISVFELKREIIAVSGLGDGTDFNLFLYADHAPDVEIKDDTTLISRGSTVIVIRRPAPRGQGRAARYVSGKAPVRAITKETSKPSPSLPSGSGAQNEEDAEAAFLQESARVWDAQKESLSHAKPVYNKQKKPVNVPNHDPPPGYVCRRCNIKGHWIQVCPTNDDPDFKPAFQAKRTTGIPRSFLKVVEKPVDEEAAKGVMLNADGEYVQVMTDTRAWEKFQEKVSVTKAQAASAEAASKELRDRGLECPIDQQKFYDPVKTPCCSKTYCRACIDNALMDGDLTCPSCGQEEVLVEDLVADEDMVELIRAYDAEKAAEKAKAAESTLNEHVIPSKSPAHSDSETSATSKKRKEAPTDIQPPSAPKAMRQPQRDPAEQAFIDQMEALKNGMPPLMGPQMGSQMGPQMSSQMGPQMGFNMGPQMGFNMGYMPNGMPQQQPGFAQFPVGQQMPFMPQQQNNDAYERQPVNNRGRGRRAPRAPDYRYL